MYVINPSTTGGNGSKMIRAKNYRGGAKRQGIDCLLELVSRHHRLDRSRNASPTCEGSNLSRPPSR